jgi:cytochrome P450
VTRHADARRILSDARRFSVATAGDRSDATARDGMSDEDAARERAGNIMACDPPEHTRLRKMLTPAFTVRQIGRIQPWIERIVEERLDQMERHGPLLDLVEWFALPIPVLVICELLGAPYEGRAEFRRLSTRSVDLSLPPSERTAATVSCAPTCMRSPLAHGPVRMRGCSVPSPASTATTRQPRN